MGSVNALLNLYCEQGKWRELISFFHVMRKQGFQPNSFTFSALLKLPSVSLPFPLYQGEMIHADAFKRGFAESDSYVINALITMYNRCGSLCKARKVFDEIPLPNVVNWNTMISALFHAGNCDNACQIFVKLRQSESPNDVTWSAMISGYTENDRPEDALLVFKQMRRECDGNGLCSPNSHTISSVFSACVKLRDLCFGQQVHGYATKISTHIENDVFVGSNLMDLYGKCYQLELAKLVFDSMVEKCVVVWSVLIASYIRNKSPSCAVDTFRDMTYRGVEPNYVTISTLITACADIPCLILGKELHGFIVRRITANPDIFVSTSLIDLYGKCHDMVYAYRVFERDKDALKYNMTPMYNATIAGFVENKYLHDAWKVFRSMNQDFTAKPNSVTLAIVLPLCTRSSLCLYGKEIHCYSLKHGLHEEFLVSNSLLDMYSKSGELRMTENQFKMMTERNAISWTTMIDAYGVHGNGAGSISTFEAMVRENGVKPDYVTFVALVSACSHSGLVEEGLKYFNEISTKYKITPMEENYGAVVDLLARAGRLDEAKNFIATMPIKPGPTVWGALLGACKIHGNAQEAAIALENLVKLEPDESGFWKLLLSIYLQTGRLDSVEEIRRAISETGVLKRQGFSWLESTQAISTS